ncbi:hypothetical protein G6F57_012100 [Rhizopus arrhizus]|nr:hypothetical protein G6F57_012100 [Rhizopus arrhizus]
MRARLNHNAMLRYSGLFTWGTVGLWLAIYLIAPVSLTLETLDGEAGFRIIPWASAYLAFGIGYWALTRSLGEGRPGFFDHAALILLTLAVDIKGILRLGPKLVLMYLGASASIMLGAVVGFLVMRAIHPDTVAGDTWAGMAALAGSWIGGGANMLAMREVFDVNATTFGQFAVVDVGVGYVWMAALIFLAGRAAKIDARSGADTSAIDELKERIARFQAEHERIPSLTDLMLIVAVAFGGVGLAHAIGAPLAAWFKINVSWAAQFSLDAPFVWVVVLSTTLGLGLSFTRARTLEGAGASRLDGSAGAAGPPVAVPARPDLDRRAHRAAVVPGQAAEGAVLLLRHRFAVEHRWPCLGAGGGRGVPSGPGAGRRAAGDDGLRHRHLSGLRRRHHPARAGRAGLSDASQFQEIAGQRPALPMLYATGKPRSINQAFASSASCSNRAE